MRGRADRRARRSWCWAAGPNRIGQGIEFDYCCVHAALAMREDGYETIMVNCNPETVSTDYDTSDRLYFEPVTLEDVLEIVDKEKPAGVIVQYGGQTPLKLALDLERAGVPIIGTIARQHRHRRGPRALPEAAARARPEAAAQPHRAHRGAGAGAGAGDRLPAGGAPELRAGRPRDGDRARRQGPASATCARRCSVSEKSPVLLDRFLDDAIEVDVDCISDGTEVMIGGIMEHVEAGRHPLRRLGLLAAAVLAAAGAAGRDAPPDRADGQGAEGRGPDERAVRDPGRGRRAPWSTCSRSTRAPRAPCPSSARPPASRWPRSPRAAWPGRRWRPDAAATAARRARSIPPYFSIKEAVFPFNKFPGVDPILGPEMRSTGEVMGVGRTFGEAMLKSQLGAGSRLPDKGTVVHHGEERRQGARRGGGGATWSAWASRSWPPRARRRRLPRPACR